MKITIETLENAGAMCVGLNWFRATYPNGFAGEWTRELQMEILRSEGRRWLGWAWDEKVVPAWSMRGADLSRADLRWADLSEADLREANLREANLREADLSEADLSEADLSEADSNRTTIWPEGFEFPKGVDYE